MDIRSGRAIKRDDQMYAVIQKLSLVQTHSFSGNRKATLFV
jgi:hypothetical protein